MTATSAIDTLAARLGCEWRHLTAAEEASRRERERLTRAIAGRVPVDTSFVVFGSLARGEFTAGSDLDWTLLIDGRADRGHPTAVREIAGALTTAGVRGPGPSGVFGNLAFSHPILHQIGGQDDSNRNTTQRILLLLESLALGPADAHQRVVDLVLERYVQDDRGLLFGKGPQLIPRVLLNDIARYWRTVTIDFVNKQNERDDGWALRNIKLRLSRKLIFVGGLLTCFAAELVGEDAGLREGGKVVPERVTAFLRRSLQRRPLEALAHVCLRQGVQPATARAIFDSYDAFLAILDDKTQREALKRHTFDDLGDSTVFRRASHLARTFQDEGIHRLFFEDEPLLRELITRHGVF